MNFCLLLFKSAFLFTSCFVMFFKFILSFLISVLHPLFDPHLFCVYSIAPLFRSHHPHLAVYTLHIYFPVSIVCCQIVQVPLLRLCSLRSTCFPNGCVTLACLCFLHFVSPLCIFFVSGFFSVFGFCLRQLLSCVKYLMN